VLYASMTLPDAPNLPERPPIVLVHGAANSGAVWHFWQRTLSRAGYTSYAMDLRGHGKSQAIDLSRTTMEDYASDVLSVASRLARRPVLTGWSMGGLVSLMAARRARAMAWVGLESSVPCLTRRAVEPRDGVFGAESYGIYGIDPDDQPQMPDLDYSERVLALSTLAQESLHARDERHAGILVDDPACPLLLIAARADYAQENYGAFPIRHELQVVPGVSHWGLVMNEEAVESIARLVLRWLQTAPDLATTDPPLFP
jgi:pimeloyl-ACP methyl ester carboxylesterase